MATNLQVLQKAIGEFTDCPFFLLSESQKAANLELMRKFFSSIYNKLSESKTQNTAVARCVKSVIGVLSAENFNEYDFARGVLSLMEKMPKSAVLKSKGLRQDFLLLSKRAKPLWVSEAIAAKQREQLTEEEILEHDKNVLANEIQLWAFDYCFFFEKLLRTAASPEQKQNIIFHDQDDMPALLDDVLSESVLVKCVYGLYGRSLREEMIRAYYEYKQPFLELKKDVELSEKQISALQMALRGFCLKLIDVSLRYNIQTVENILHFPYGKGKSIKELQAELSK